MKTIPREFIESLLAKVDIVDFINTHVPLSKKSGSNYFARCPFHQEKSASFSVSQPKQFYYCFGCGAHGNAIDFVMQFDRLNFPEAIETLAKQHGMEVPRTVAKNQAKEDSILSLYDLMEKVADYYYEQMRSSTQAIQYLKQRNITGDIAKQFSLGYAVPGWRHLIEHLGKSTADLKKLSDTGLIIKKESADYYDRFRDRIMFPIHDYRGRVIGFGGRILDQGEPKYLNSPETVLFQKGSELYGLYHALKTNRQLKRVLIVEGYMDVIALFQHGISYAVATLGTATTPQHIKRLARYTSDMIFCFDGDKAGRLAAWRALEVIFPIMQDSLQIRFLFLPEGEDPDSLVHKEGKSAFESRIQQAFSLSDFFFHSLSQESDMQNMEGRARFATVAMQYIKKLPSGFFQSILIDELSKRARVDRLELKTQITPQTATAEILPNIQKSKAKLPAPMRLIIALLIQQPKLVTLIDDALAIDDLPGGSFLETLIAKIKAHPSITTAILKEHYRSQKEEELITKLANWEPMIPAQGVEHEFVGALRQLLILSLDEKINQLLAKSAQSGLSSEEKLLLSATIAKKKQTTAVKLGEANI